MDGGKTHVYIEKGKKRDFEIVREEQNMQCILYTSVLCVACMRKSIIPYTGRRDERNGDAPNTTYDSLSFQNTQTSLAQNKKKKDN